MCQYCGSKEDLTLIILFQDQKADLLHGIMLLQHAHPAI